MNNHRRNRYFLPSIIIILFVTLSPVDGQSIGLNIDKLVHFLIFGFLGINVCYKFWESPLLVDCLMWSIFFGFITEFIQQFIPGRGMDIYDGIADMLGVIGAFYFYKIAPNFCIRLFNLFNA